MIQHRTHRTHHHPGSHHSPPPPPPPPHVHPPHDDDELGQDRYFPGWSHHILCTCTQIRLAAHHPQNCTRTELPTIVLAWHSVHILQESTRYISSRIDSTHVTPACPSIHVVHHAYIAKYRARCTWVLVYKYSYLSTCVSMYKFTSGKV